MKLKKICLILSFMGAVLCSLAQEKKNCLNLIPLPQSVELKSGKFIINEETKIICNNKFNASYLKKILDAATKLDLKIASTADNIGTNYIKFNLSGSLDIPKEGYELSVLPHKIEINSSSKEGEFYAIQTLLQLLPASIYGNAMGWEKWEIPAVKISDYPRFEYRGFMLDVSRTFFSKEVICKVLDWLAFHKLNKFHWHITDDNGWRIEIKKYPLLTQKGAWRGPGEVLPAVYGSGNKRYGGFYTQKEIREIIKYAADRNIEIIPEIDMPGHSRSIAQTYPQTSCDVKTYIENTNSEAFNIWCVGRAEKTNFKMLDDIIKEVAELFPSKTIHIGGDEVNFKIWNECKECRDLMAKKGFKKENELQNYFVRKVESIIEKYGKHMAGWDEILEGGKLEKETRIYAWRSEQKGIDAVKKGHKTIMQICSYCYFDMKQSPLERGHKWANIFDVKRVYEFDPISTLKLNKEEESLVLGPQAGLWCELLNRPYRFMEYQCWPRLAALAEVAWTKQEKREWDDFNERLSTTHFERLFNMGIAFRLAFPKVNYINNTLKIELPYKWASVRYTTDGSEPTINSNIYTGDIVTFEPEKFRFATFYKDVLKSISVGAQNIELFHYLKPNLSIETSFKENPKFPIKNVWDYDFNTYWKTERTGVKGDYVIYNFTEELNCKKITVELGSPNITLWGVADGDAHLEYSYDGIKFIKGDSFVDNIAVIYPIKAVKSVKIVIDDTSDGPNLSVQDLRIE